MTSEVGQDGWDVRYPDLAGKVAVLAGTSSVLFEVACVLVTNGVTPALVVDDRALVGRATRFAERVDVASFGVVADPAERDTWNRVAPHIEQRLGPIDIVIAIAPPALRRLVATALMPDMAARKRGVIVEAGSSVEPLTVPPGLRHRAVRAGAGATAADIAAAVALCASDTVNSPSVSIDIS